MDAFIYNADIYCPTCAAKIKAQLDGEGKTPANPDDESSYDSGQYPKGPTANGGGETDSPQHCADCKVYLGAPLTDDGIKYAVNSLAEYVTDDGGTAEVLDEWADDLKGYSLDDEHQRFVLAAYEKVRELEKEIGPLHLEKYGTPR